ncbi:MAG: CBS domain-containing protein [Candidatus Omnitrophica bacterium]|nr:CBS domain-containing protein [Candidatus Omnitrophota bacterium]
MLPVSSIMTKEVVSVMPDTPVIEALDLLRRHKISGLPVTSQAGRVVGILSEKDLLRILLEKNVDVCPKVEDYMTREVICFTESDDAVEICKFFLRSTIRRVPIVDNGRLVGIVSRRDILTLVMEAKSKMSVLRYV